MLIQLSTGTADSCVCFVIVDGGWWVPFGYRLMSNKVLTCAHIGPRFFEIYEKCYGSSVNIVCARKYGLGGVWLENNGLHLFGALLPNVMEIILHRKHKINK